jgi:hypothetical protein
MRSVPAGRVLSLRPKPADARVDTSARSAAPSPHPWEAPGREVLAPLDVVGGAHVRRLGWRLRIHEVVAPLHVQLDAVGRVGDQEAWRRAGEQAVDVRLARRVAAQDPVRPEREQVARLHPGLGGRLGDGVGVGQPGLRLVAGEVGQERFVAKRRTTAPRSRIRTSPIARGTGVAHVVQDPALPGMHGDRLPGLLQRDGSHAVAFDPSRRRRDGELRVRRRRTLQPRGPWLARSGPAAGARV